MIKVLCHGVFDIFHVGHLRHLKKAKQLGDYLIVSITPDKYVDKGPDRPTFNENYRAEVIRGLKFVDEVIINNHYTAIDVINKIKPDIYVKGKDYKDLEDDILISEKQAVEKNGGKIAFTEEITFSSSKLVNNSKLSEEAKNHLKVFKNVYTYKDILTYIESLKDLSVVVIGESIKDEYMFGETLGKSGKSPIVAFKNDKLEIYDGGVLAIYNHLVNFCNVDLETSYKMIVKRRYIQDNQKLFETYDHREEIKYFNEPKDLDNYDLVIVADFGHGYIDGDYRKLIQSTSNFIALNTQSNAGNMGLNTINKYGRKADYICIDENELRLAISNSEDTIKDILKNNFSNESLIMITRGFNGSILYKDGRFYESPAFATNVIDATGAGDAVLAITSLLIKKDVPAEVVIFIGNCVGALATSYQGNKKCVTKSNLCKYISTVMK